RRATGEPSMHVWPLITRVEHAEKERLDAARTLARSTFQRHLGHLTRSARAEYWSSTEVLYQPFFAYEEVLAVFAEQRGPRASMLSAMENLAAFLSDHDVTQLAHMSETDRQRGLRGFERPRPEKKETSSSEGSPGRIFVTHANEDRETVRGLVAKLTEVLG